MNKAYTTKLIEATIAAVAVIGLAAVVLPHTGIVAAGVLIAGALAAMGTLEAKKRAY